MPSLVPTACLGFSSFTQRAPLLLSPPSISAASVLNPALLPAPLEPPHFQLAEVDADSKQMKEQGSDCPHCGLLAPGRPRPASLRLFPVLLLCLPLKDVAFSESRACPRPLAPSSRKGSKATPWAGPPCAAGNLRLQPQSPSPIGQHLGVRGPRAKERPQPRPGRGWATGAQAHRRLRSRVAGQRDATVEPPCAPPRWTLT